MHLQIYEEKMKTMHTNYFILEKSAYICTVKHGGLAQLARALAWHARGHEFDSRILHKRKGNQFRLPFFVCILCYPPPKSPSCEGDLSLRFHNGIRGELVTSEALLFKGGFGWIVYLSPCGVRKHPRVRLSYSPQTKRQPISVAFFRLYHALHTHATLSVRMGRYFPCIKKLGPPAMGGPRSFKNVC